ncbi:MAG: hypothetical protein M0025_08265 [Elusimicrobia bacterium]|nr:hypothetical protein [Elusimicrobiota bacterium]MDA8244097.1 hypothetical protein [Elusimicrobiota bacterium]
MAGSCGKRKAYALAGAGLFLAALAVLWLYSIAPSFSAERARRAALRPMMKEAGELSLTYEGVLAAPEKAVGKQALWCLKRMAPDSALYGGSSGKPVHISGSGLPPSRTYRRDCDETLLTIRAVTATEFPGGQRSLRITAEFVAYP